MRVLDARDSVRATPDRTAPSRRRQNVDTVTQMLVLSNLLCMSPALGARVRLCGPDSARESEVPEGGRKPDPADAGVQHEGAGFPYVRILSTLFVAID